MIIHKSNRAMSLCLAMSIAAAGLLLPVHANDASGLKIDERIHMVLRKFISTSELLPDKDPSERTDEQDQWYGCATGISNTPGGWNQFRAKNLAASGHFDEAIKELTIAIDSYPDSQMPKLKVDPNYFVQRGGLYDRIGERDNALKDFEHVASLVNCFQEAKFAAAQYLLKNGHAEEAERALENLTSTGFNPYKSTYFYFLGLAQTEQKKTDEARASFLEAANLYAANGFTQASEACLERVNKLAKQSDPSSKVLTASDLIRPKSNFDKMKQLVETLATDKDCLNLEVLKKITGAASFKRYYAGYLVQPYQSHFKEIQLLTLKQLPSSGLLLEIQLDAISCALQRSDFKDILQKSDQTGPNVPNQPGYLTGNLLKAPGGILVLSWKAGGFEALTSIAMYSDANDFPPKPVPRQRVRASDVAYARHENMRHYRQFKNYSEAMTYVSKWLEEEPNNPGAYIAKADIQARMGLIDDALKTIEEAIVYSPKDLPPQERRYGNTPLLRKASYLMEKGRYQEGYELFEKGAPESLRSDDLLLRGRFRIGLKDFSNGVQDLKLAANQFYKECRIVRRDETEKLVEQAIALQSHH